MTDLCVLHCTLAPQLLQQCNMGQYSAQYNFAQLCNIIDISVVLLSSAVATNPSGMTVAESFFKFTTTKKSRTFFCVSKIFVVHFVFCFVLHYRL